MLTPSQIGFAGKPYRKFFLQYIEEYFCVDWSKTYHNSKTDIVSDLNTKIEHKDNYTQRVVLETQSFFVTAKKKV